MQFYEPIWDDMRAVFACGMVELQKVQNRLSSLSKTGLARPCLGSGAHLATPLATMRALKFP